MHFFRKKKMKNGQNDLNSRIEYEKYQMNGIFHICAEKNKKKKQEQSISCRSKWISIDLLSAVQVCVPN